MDDNKPITKWIDWLKQLFQDWLTHDISNKYIDLSILD